MRRRARAGRGALVSGVLSTGVLSTGVLGCLLVVACGAPEPATKEQPRFDLDATRQLIAQQTDRFTNAHLSGDVAMIDAMFAVDAVAYPPGGDAVRDPDALHAFTVEYINAGLTAFREESTEFYGNAEYVVDAGTYDVTYGPEHITERGKYLNVWQHVDGRWLIKSNMWNTDAPTPE